MVTYHIDIENIELPYIEPALVVSVPLCPRNTINLYTLRLIG